MRYHDGPISNVKPPSLYTLARPPGPSFFSITVILKSSFARRAAADNPPNHDPTIMTSITTPPIYKSTVIYIILKNYKLLYCGNVRRRPSPLTLLLLRKGLPEKSVIEEKI
ncbi:hypothetical protein [Methanothermobacter wolfeii]|uniref:hypothetical protein n=1 Tax=Methanothermobacter wolfeii TaxID=145261 RepID=UPI0024B354FA|nr:hypothetical protein [Methanothermobacter wolfeii]MDI6702696.1 hypothetical protein [Methanothermobacter wolfeii]